MKTAHQKGNTYILNAARGEEVVAALKNVLREKNIRAAHFTGLGAADFCDVAYYNLRDKKFEQHEMAEETEILSLVGNVGMLGDETIIHAHGVFGRRDLSTFGGHIFAMRVSGACEIHLTVLDGEMTRAHDDETGLNLLCGASAR
ncbi:MAG: PPC domain-containing DNA-binding protein [Patescibacteria group bacterium]